MTHPVLERAAASLKLDALNWRGDLSLLDHVRRAILISRTPRAAAPSTPWVRHVLAATAQIVQAGEVLVTGTGRLPFELALFAAAKAQGAAIVVLTDMPRASFDGQTLLPARHLLVWPDRSASATDARNRRDRLLAALSAAAHSIAIRQGGTMEKLCEQMHANGLPVQAWPACAYVKKNKLAAKLLEIPAHLRPPATSDFSIHLTREPAGPWPGEEPRAYLDWLSGAEPFSPRDAFGSLCRILQEQRLRASGRLIKGSQAAVCFTARATTDLEPLRRWRRGLMRWSVSKYGLAIRRTALERLGARAVGYVDREKLAHASAHERLFMQLCQSQAGDWSRECEWRFRGDVDLRRFSKADLLALVAHPDEAAVLRERFGVAACIP